MKIIFFGSSDFSLPILKWLKGQPDFEIVGVVTTPPAPKGRGQIVSPNCVETYARAENYLLFAPPDLKDEAFLKALAEVKPEMLLVVSYGKMLPQRVLGITPLPVNIHPSLLPKYRGPNPILAPILSGDLETGVTIMQITEKLDAGGIFLQNRFRLDSRMTGGELEKKLVLESIKLLEGFFKNIKEGSNLSPVPQNEQEATYTHKIHKDDTKLSWDEPVIFIDRKVRAYSPKPRAFFEFRGKKVFVEQGECIANETCSEKVIIDSLDREEGSVTLNLGQGQYVLKRVAPEGKSAMRAYDFIQGYRLKSGAIFN